MINHIKHLKGKDRKLHENVTAIPIHCQRRETVLLNISSIYMVAIATLFGNILLGQ